MAHSDAWGSPEWVRQYLARYGFPPLGGAEDDPPADPPADPPTDPPADPPPEPIKPEDDWKEKARKHERDLKKERERAAKLEADLKEFQDKTKSEQEKAVDAAREEGRTAALTEAEKERRSDRLEVAVTRLASKGITIGEGDDAKSLTFADSEDALLRVNRGDTADLFDEEGKVKEDAVKEALADILERSPHLAGGEAKKAAGDPDARKGAPAKNDLESMTAEEHAQRKYAPAK